MHKARLLKKKHSSRKYREDAFSKIQKETGLSTKQIKDFYNTFISNSDNGFMDIRRFRVVLGLLDNDLLSQMIFNAMDTDNNNLLDFYEFGRSLAIMISENFDEKAKFSYRIIKGDYMNLGDGITFENLLKSIRVIDNARYMLVGPHILSVSDQEIKNFFMHYSTLKEGDVESKIYFESYKMAIQDSPEFLSFFGIITPNVLESYELDGKKSQICESSNNSNRLLPDGAEYMESIEKESNLQRRISPSSFLDDIKSMRQETANSLNTLEKWINIPGEDHMLNCMFFDLNSESEILEQKSKLIDQNKAFNTFISDMLVLKNVLNHNIETLDSIYKRGISLQNKHPSSQATLFNGSIHSGIIKRVYNRRKMYINKGNVAPNTKHRLSASEMIKKTFMHKSTSNVEYGRHNYNNNNNRRRTSLAHMYMHKSNISGGFQNMGKGPSKIKIRSLRSNTSLVKSKCSNLDRESPLNVVNTQIKRNKGYVVYIGHESWNTVLNMMVGMRLAIGRVYSEPNRNVADYDFIMKEKFFIIPRDSRQSSTKSNIPAQKTSDCRGFVKPVQFIDYNPMVFRKIREICNVSPESYVRSVGPEQLLGNMVLGNLSSMNELCSEGKSGAFFYYTTDGRFLIKTVEKKTATFFRSILNKYYNHIEKNKNSLITRIYGLHALRFKKPLLQPLNTLREQISSSNNSMIRKSKIHKIFFIVMENIFHTPVEIHRRYDIKGSWIGRSTPSILQEDKTIALKELDMKSNKEMLFIDQQNQVDLLKQLEIDCRFFELYNIMDYSLLIGIHYVEDESQNISSLIENESSRRFVGILSSDKKKVYYLGFIDFFSTWNTVKKLERLYKTITIRSSNGISAVPPDKYALRFMKFIKSRITL
ncbi:putative phosphatidylinositol-4-phosphate 5-kinase [Cryptosporidium canis]|nr:putative phosphatidylinositol-4-phosphate 5-kinase [Cryptosporidium canis]